MIVANAEEARAQLRGTSVYVYSFLDIREPEFGNKVLDQFHRQLIEGLRENSVSPHLQLFAKSTAGALWVPGSPKIADGQRTTDQLPVLETIASNRAREAAVAARYRLLVLPANFELIGAWRHYTVRWILMDAATDEIIWRRDYAGSHMTIWRTNENAEGRGRKLTQAGLAMMREDRLL